MRHWIGAAALALAACGSGGDDKAAQAGNDAAGGSGAEANAAGAGVTSTAAGGSGATMQPGQWEITTAVTGMEGVPGGTPPGATNPSNTTRTCLTPEQVAQPATGIASGGLTNQAGCRAERSNVSGGRIDTVVQCEAPGGGRVRVTTTGETGATSFDIESRSEVSAQGTNMTTRTRVTGRRLGDCPA
jgi:hypothetical protein